jgi:hypothetical protein
MKKQKEKVTEDQVKNARRKKINSFDFRSRVKNFIESLKILNSSKKDKLNNSDLRKIAFNACDTVDVSFARAKETSSTTSPNEDLVPKKSLKY